MLDMVIFYKKLKLFFYSLVFWLLNIGICFAHLDISVYQNINFGSYIRLNEQSNVTLSTSGYTTYSGLKTSANNRPFVGIFILNNCFGSLEKTFASNISVSDKCASINPTSVIFSSNPFYNKMGATININSNACRADTISQGIITGSILINATCNNYFGGQDSGTAPINFKIRIREPDIIIQQTKALNFGTIFNSSSAFSVTVAPNGNITGSTNKLISSRGKTPSNASFSIVGAIRTPVSVEIMPKSIFLYNESSGNKMEVTNFVGKLDNGSLEAIMPKNGLTLNVGATLLVNADQAPGVYRGQYNVVVHY